MPMQSLCTITEKEWLTYNVVSMTVAAGKLARETKPGQFVNVGCGDGYFLRRPISVCEVNGDRLTLVFAEKGDGTRWLAKRKPAENLDILGPLGHGFTIPRDGNIILTGGGIGVPPLLQCAKKVEGNATAVLGFRSENEAILVDDFKRYCRKVVVCTEDGSMGTRGLVDALLKQVISESPASYTDILACGPRPMLKAVSKVASDMSIACQVSMEERMGCGIGACLGCSCKIKEEDGIHYKQVCKDGPVFDSKEVCWDDE